MSYETLKEAMDKLEAQTKALRNALEASREDPPYIFKPTLLVDRRDRDALERIREKLGLRTHAEVLSFTFDKFLELERRIANSTEEQAMLFMGDLFSDHK